MLHKQCVRAFLSPGILFAVHLPVTLSGELTGNGLQQSITECKPLLVPSGEGVNKITELEEKGSFLLCRRETSDKALHAHQPLNANP